METKLSFPQENINLIPASCFCSLVSSFMSDAGTTVHDLPTPLPLAFTPAPDHLPCSVFFLSRFFGAGFGVPFSRGNTRALTMPIFGEAGGM